MLEIDGGYLEGGGQIVRTAIALSAITKIPVRIFNIRKGRQNPGLKSQHLEGIKATAKICNGEVSGVFLNSTEVSFIPGDINGGYYTIDTRTAGAITLILQTLTPIGLFAPQPLKLDIKGGTAVPFSPTISYYEDIFCFYLKKMGIEISVNTKRHGFYPRGGGSVAVCINQGILKPVDFIETGQLKGVYVYSISSVHLKNARVGERLINGFQSVYPGAQFKYRYVESDSPGCFIHSVISFDNCQLGVDGLGERGKPAEQIGKEVANKVNLLVKYQAVVDDWMIDQLIPYIALATYFTGKQIKIKFYDLTKHAQTNIWVVEQFLPVRFEIQDNILECHKIVTTV